MSEIEEYDVFMDDQGRKFKMCKRECSCHDGASYNQIECRCEHFCGDEIQ